MAEDAQTPEEELAQLRALLEKFGVSNPEIEARIAELEKQAQQKATAVRVEGGGFASAGDMTLTGEHIAGRDINIGVQAGTQRMTLYLKQVLRDTRELSLRGIDPQAARESDSALDLATVYTALNTTWREYERDDPDEMQAALMERGEGRTFSALEAANRAKHLILLGDPGSGKSTFVDYLALCLAAERLQPDEGWLKRLEDEGDWSHGALLPVRVVLREFAARGLPPIGRQVGAGCLWAFIEKELGEHLAAFAETLCDRLVKEGGVVLLDGLDEAPEAGRRREQIKQAAEAFAADFDKCRVIVTSRTYAYQNQEWRLDDFQPATLAPFDDEQVKTFVKRWYAHAADKRGDLSAQDAEGSAMLLTRAIENSAELREMAGRPLLLTLMASLHAWRGGSLPEKREELYADSVELLLSRWEQPKIVRDAEGKPQVMQESLREALSMESRRLRAVLERVACEVHAAQPKMRGTADIKENLLVGALVQENPDLRPARIVEFLRDRAGLLEAHGVGVYRFPHRSFQEYLAACHLTGSTFPDELTNLVFDRPDLWREVALLAAAKVARGTPHATWILINALLPQETPEEAPLPREHTRWWAMMLAGQMVLENDLHRDGQNLRNLKHVRCWLAALLETGALPVVDRTAAGRVLSVLGDDRPGVGLDSDGVPDIAWVEIPAGEFLMGSTKAEVARVNKETDGNYYNDELRRHKVDLPTYRIAKYPITWAQYAAFVDDAGYERPGYWDDQTYHIANHPVNGVTWYDAMAFCKWLSGKLDYEVRLPTEAEWEKAARGDDGRRYPWGDEFDAGKCNMSETGIGRTSAVGMFPDGASPYGVLDLSGNVYEWCQSKYKSYPYHPNDGREDTAGGGSRVLRGGSLIRSQRYVRAACRGDPRPSRVNWLNGFRVVAPTLRLVARRSENLPF